MRFQFIIIEILALKVVLYKNIMHLNFSIYIRLIINLLLDKQDVY